MAAKVSRIVRAAVAVLDDDSPLAPPVVLFFFEGVSWTTEKLTSVTCIFNCSRTSALLGRERVHPWPSAFDPGGTRHPTIQFYYPLTEIKMERKFGVSRIPPQQDSANQHWYMYKLYAFYSIAHQLHSACRVSRSIIFGTILARGSTTSYCYYCSTTVARTSKAIARCTCSRTSWKDVGSSPRLGTLGYLSPFTSSDDIYLKGRISNL